jgi:hypothetical protein
MVMIKNGERLPITFGEGQGAFEVLAGVQDHDGEVTVAFMLPAGRRCPKIGTCGDIDGKTITITEITPSTIDGMVELVVTYG